MANWTDLSAAFAYGTKLTSTQMQQLRDKITALAEGASGAPSDELAAMDANSIDSPQYVDDSIDTAHYAPGSVDQNALGANCVGQSEVKTGTGTASASIAGQTYANITMQDYCLSPNIYPGAYDFTLWAHSSGAAGYVGRFAVFNEEATNSRTYVVYWMQLPKRSMCCTCTVMCPSR